MLIYSTKGEIEAYYNSPNLNQSQLKKLLIDLDFFLSTKEPELYFEEKESLTIGSLVDFLITRPSEELTDTYYISGIQSKPSDVVMSIINNFVDILFEKNIEIKDIDDETYSDMLFEIIENHNYCKTYSREVRLKKIYAEKDYFVDVVNSRGKKIISVEEYFTASKISENIKDLSLIKKCFEDFAENPDVLVFLQKPIYFTFEDIPCKSLPDIIIYDTKTKSIIIIDIKTTYGKTLDFLIPIKKYRYDIQMAWYHEACKVEFKTDKIKCLFAVESTTKQGNAILLSIDQDLINCGLKGLNEVYYEGMLLRREQKGIIQLIDLYKYYEKNSFKEEKIILESSPYKLLKVGLNKIY